MGPGITHYQVLGVLPTAGTAQIRRCYDAKASLLRPELLSGAISTVVSAARRAQENLDASWRVLSDPEQRVAYDEALGIRRTGEGLERPPSVPSEPGWDTSYLAPIAYRSGGAAFLLGGLVGMADFLTARAAPPLSRHVTVPDVSGLFYSVCFETAGKMGIRLTAVRLTENPMPVDGLVVDQSPRPLTKARRDSVLTVRVWHPAKTGT
jgi:hypothetical protein